MIAIVVFEVGIIIAAFTKKNDLEDIVDKRLNETLHKYNENKAFAASWHLLQTEVFLNNEFIFFLVKYQLTLDFVTYIVEMLRNQRSK